MWLWCNFANPGLHFVQDGRGVIVMVVQLTWSCLCLRSGGANYLEVLVFKGWWCNLQIGGALSGDVVRVELYLMRSSTIKNGVLTLC